MEVQTFASTHINCLIQFASKWISVHLTDDATLDDLRRSLPCVNDENVDLSFNGRVLTDGDEPIIHLARGDRAVFQGFPIRRGGSSLAIEESLRKNMDLFWKCRDRQEVEKVFDQHSQHSNGKRLILSGDDFAGALREVGITLGLDTAVEHFKRLDLDDKKGLDLAEFRRALSLVSTPAVQWAQSLPLGDMLGRLLDCKRSSPRTDERPLRAVSQLSLEEVEAVVRHFAEGTRRLLTKELGMLGASLKALDSASHSRSSGHFGGGGGLDFGGGGKFATAKMSAGGVDDFHKGLVDLVGLPRPNIAEAMREEHVLLPGHAERFVTPNYGVSTTPAREYEVALDPALCTCDERLDKEGNVVRLLRTPRSVRAESPLARGAGLTDEEILAVMLYTGPMYVVYNAVLRRFPEEHYKRFTGDGVNRFATTIFVLVSAIVKISRATKLPTGLELFRGTGGGVDLPDSFYEEDQMGRKGFMEYGFLSTTTSRDVALKYSGVRGGPLPLVLRIVTGSIDRGACIAELSQYPHELEYLWVPCSFIAPDGPPSVELVPAGEESSEVGVVTIVPVRINANLKSESVDELIQRKKRRHLDTFRYQILEVERHLREIACDPAFVARLKVDTMRTMKVDDWVKAGGDRQHLAEMSNGNSVTFTVEGLVRKLVQEVKDVRVRHERLNPKDYHKTGTYKRLVSEMLRSGVAPVSAMQWYLEDKFIFMEFVMRRSCFRMHVGYMGFLRQKLQPLAGKMKEQQALILCKQHGLVGEEGVNAFDGEGLTPLMRVAQDGAGEWTVRLLVKAGADVTMRDSDLRTALHIAAEFGHGDIVYALARCGADVNVCADHDSNKSAVFVAAQEGHVDVVQELADLRANIHTPDSNGRTPLFIAAASGHLEVVRVLLNLGAKVNAAAGEAYEFYTPLHIAAAEEHADVVQALVDGGADVSAATSSGATALHFAEAQQRENIAQILRVPQAQQRSW